MVVKLSAVEARAQDSDFVAQCSLWGLQEQLPLCWPTPPDIPPSPKNRYRSQCGHILNIGQTFKDGSLRLVRDLPVGSPTWKRLYHQACNASESRNPSFERWDLKRLPVYGGLRAKAFAYLGDTWATLTTLARLVHEATLATSTA